MKKILLSAAIVFAAVAGTVCYNSENRNENEMSDLAKANIDALAKIEIPMLSGNLCFENYAYTSDNEGKVILRIRPCNQCDITILVTSCSDASECVF